MLIMHKLDGLDWLLILLLCTFVSSMTLLMAVGDYQDKLHECQKELPRSQQCKLIAVPEGKIDEHNRNQ